MNFEKSRVLIGIIGLLTLVIASLGGYIVYDKFFKEGYDAGVKKSEKKPSTSDKESLDSGKIDKTKAFIYDAPYLDKTSKIELPMINLNSKEAEVCNAEIQDLYNKLLQYQAKLEITSSGTISSSYEYIVNGNVLSVVIHTVTKETDATDNYYTYNFNLKEKTRLTYSDIYQVAGMSDANIRLKIENALSDYMNQQGTDLWESNRQRQEYMTSTIQKYDESVKNNTVQYYLDKNKNLNIIASIMLPVGNGEFKRVVTVK